MEYHHPGSFHFWPRKEDMADNRPPAYWEGDTLIVRCSALGGCLWELIAAAQDYAPLPPPKFLQKAFEAGQEAEPIVLNYLSTHGWTLVDSQKEAHLRGAPNVLIRYHPDSIGEWEGETFVVEVKALGPDLFSKARRHGVGSTIGEYNWQISVMMHGEQLPGMWVAMNKETGEVIFERIDEPPVPLADILAKVAKLVGSLDDDLMDRPCDDPKHFPCRYIHLRPEPEGVEDSLDVERAGIDKEFDQLAREYLTYKGMKDEAEKKLEVLREQLLAMRGSFKKAESSRFVITVGQGSTSRVNFDQLKDDGVYEKYVTKKPHDRLTVRGKNE